MNPLHLTTLFLFVLCGQTKSNLGANESASLDTAKTFTLTDETIEFLWRDSSSSIVIDEEFCKTISDPEKAALGYVATFIGNDCW